MSRSNKSRKPKNHSKRINYRYESYWVYESNREQRVRLKREMDRVLKDPDHEVQITSLRESFFFWS